MTAHSRFLFSSSNPLSRLSPLARRYLQEVRHIPVHAHSVRRAPGLYGTQDISITPVELIVLLLSVGVVIGILFFISLLAIQSCIASVKRRLGYKDDKNMGTRVMIPPLCRRSSCDRSVLRSESYVTAPEQLRSSTSTMALRTESGLRKSGSVLTFSKYNNYGTVDPEARSQSPSPTKHTPFPQYEEPVKQTPFNIFEAENPTRNALFGTPEREPLMGSHVVGNRPGIGSGSGYGYVEREGQTPWGNRCEKTEPDIRDSPSSGRSAVHRDDCDNSCGARRRSIDRYIV